LPAGLAWPIVPAIMRIAVVSDVHANLAALEAVLAHAEQERALDEVWALGDLVGYGPRPSECIALLRAQKLLAVPGNHDLAAVGVIDTSAFNPAAAQANRWNAAQLTDDDRAFLRGLERTAVRAPFSLAHGSMHDPVWEYVITTLAALHQFAAMTTPYGFVGHTHMPLVIVESREDQATLGPVTEPRDGDLQRLGENRLVLNPGSVGQPRDGDSRAAYAILDSEALTVRFHRVEYAIERTQREMADAGLPKPLIARLARGR
jgi:predicted phosphodiesterase